VRASAEAAAAAAADTGGMALGRSIAAGAFAAALLAAPATATPRLELRACVARGVPARCGTMLVPENRARPGGRTIGLRVVVLPARTKTPSRDAFTYLAGGPGGAATDLVESVAVIWSSVRARHDIVLVDQRGTGRSNRLECPVPAAPLETKAERAAYVSGCLRELDGDPTQYGTVAAADDLEAVRVALGYSSLDVYGTSYGATAAQVYLNRHPRSVRTVVLDGGTALGVPFYGRFAANGQRALDLVAARCAASRSCARSFPRWPAQLNTLIARWNARPRTVGDAGKVTGDGLAGVVQQMTLDDESAAAIPLVVSRAALGDVAPLSRYVSADGATRLVMFWSVMCNEPWVGLSSRGASGTYLDGYAKASVALLDSVCAYLPRRSEPAAVWRTPRSNVPMLALAGGADPQDPAANLAGLARTPASRVIVVPGLGHAIGQLGCLGSLVGLFVDRGTARGLDTSCIRTIRPHPFQLD
jgi:pimeloyl-ACP methyl ester carboxylesterase